jgi:peptidoglycan/LPS O-acetylase OafA/YrhL
MKRQRLFFMFFIVFAYWVIYILLSSSYANLIPCSKLLRYFWRVFNIDCMAIGGIFALLSFYNSSWLKWLTLNSVFYASIATVLLLILSDFYIMYVHYQFFSALFGIIILNLATNKNIKIQLENIYFNYLGNISYGLYMYHPIAIVISIVLCFSIGITDNFILYPLCLFLTILMASISYKYYELPFLKIKEKYNLIK